MTIPLASVILCTRNRAAQLQSALEALKLQTLARDSYEVLVVNDGSTDHTPDILRATEKAMPHFRHVTSSSNIGLASARNLGVSHALGEFLLFTDDDCIPRPNWVERMVYALKNDPLVAGAIESPSANYWQLSHNIAQFHPFLAGRKPERTIFIAGANMAMLRNVFESLGGFAAGQRTAEDMEFVLRAARQGLSVFFQPDAAVLHNPPRSSLPHLLGYAEAHARETVLIRKKFTDILGSPWVLRSPCLLLLCSPAIALWTTISIFAGNRMLLRRHAATAPAVFAAKMAWCIGAAESLARSSRANRVSPS